MQVEIITIGDEILIGQIVDTNSAWMATELNKAGFEIAQITSVHDKADHIIEALENALQRAEIVLFTGGIGPTKDDITKQTLSRFFNSTLVFNQDVLDDIEALLKNRQRAMNELTRSQAMVPDKATIIRNPIGTAPITWFDYAGKVVVSMPGVPYEMKHAMQTEIIPRLQKQFNAPHILHQNILVTGYPESALAIKLTDWENNLPDDIRLAYLPNFTIVKLRLSASTRNPALMERIMQEKVAALRDILGNAIIAEEDLKPEEILVKLLTSAKWQIATAESCTGGRISSAITAVPGSSACFKGSVIAYSNEIKTQLLQVPASLLESCGAVSRQVAESMATGAQKLMQTDIAIATTGIAGPGGGTPEKPVGTVWIAIAIHDKVLSKTYTFNLTRALNLERTVQTALLWAIEEVRKCLNQN